MSTERLILDDLQIEPRRYTQAEMDAAKKKLWELFRENYPEASRCGEYLNRAGERVTWESGSNDNMKWLSVHTWPKDKDGA